MGELADKLENVRVELMDCLRLADEDQSNAFVGQLEFIVERLELLQKKVE
ncbi:hypothetical protein [Caballeronia sp. GAFFF2]|nr:hypothetical protein [Caballeronia sp. GAFFF2]